MSDAKRLFVVDRKVQLKNEFYRVGSVLTREMMINEIGSQVRKCDEGIGSGDVGRLVLKHGIC